MNGVKVWEPPFLPTWSAHLPTFESFRRCVMYKFHRRRTCTPTFQPPCISPCEILFNWLPYIQVCLTSFSPTIPLSLFGFPFHTETSYVTFTYITFWMEIWILLSYYSWTPPVVRVLPTPSPDKRWGYVWNGSQQTIQNVTICTHLNPIWFPFPYVKTMITFTHIPLGWKNKYYNHTIVVLESACKTIHN